MPPQAHLGLLDNFEVWQLIFTVLQSFFSFRNFFPKHTAVTFPSSCCAHLKGRASLPTYKAGCDLPSWKSFTVSGDDAQKLG